MKEMDTTTANKLEYILSGYNVSMDDRDAIIDLMDEYASQFRQEWIPVEERLPESMTNVLTTIKISDEIFVCPNWFTDHWYMHNDNVVAWQPITFPQPYNPTKS